MRKLAEVCVWKRPCLDSNICCSKTCFYLSGLVAPLQMCLLQFPQAQTHPHAITQAGFETWGWWQYGWSYFHFGSEKKSMTSMILKKYEMWTFFFLNVHQSISHELRSRRRFRVSSRYSMAFALHGRLLTCSFRRTVMTNCVNQQRFCEVFLSLCRSILKIIIPGWYF